MMQFHTCMALVLAGALFALAPARAATTHNLTGSAGTTHASHGSSDGTGGNSSSDGDSTGSGHAHADLMTHDSRAPGSCASHSAGTALPPSSSSDCGNNDTSGGSGSSHESAPDSGLGWQSLLPGSIQ